MSARTLFQLYNVACGTAQVAKESAKIITADLSNCLSSIPAVNFNCTNEIYHDARLKSEQAKAKSSNRPFDFSNVEDASDEIDVFKLAREKSDEIKRNDPHDKSLNSSNSSNSTTLFTDDKRTTPNNGGAGVIKRNPDFKSKREFSTFRYLNNKEDSNSSLKNKLVGEKEKPQFELNQSAVPSSRLSRLFHYGTLAAGVGLEVLKEGAKQYAKTQKAPDYGSLILSPRNLERIAKKFTKMRGAALKVGQMLSFQDSSVLPPEIQQILLRVQNSAHYMPAGQLEKVMAFELGDNWRSRLFASFEDVPIAAASIGQVHRAVTKGELEQVVVKVQYPGVANSIDSDLDNILSLLTLSRLLPPGLFLDKSVANARVELKWECDYIREAQNMVRFHELLKDDDTFVVPKVYHELSGEHILTMQEMKGTEIVKGDWDQETKNWIATNIMRLTLREIAEFRFMQTDPNWANFLYNDSTKKIELLDFGASRDYPEKFVNLYVNCLRSAVKKDREGAERYSKEMGFLTGLESESMVKAHVDSIMALGEPFSPVDNKGKPFNFANQTVTDRVRGNISLMLQERLTPPPEETYSLHRKLSGAYLLCARMNAVVPCEEIFDEIIGFEGKK